MTQIGDILQSNQIANLSSMGFNTKLDIREASDDELLNVPQIGPATLDALREWAKLPPQKGKEAISRRFLLLKNADGGRLDVRPGDIIPEEFDPETQVKDGKAEWR